MIEDPVNLNIYSSNTYLPQTGAYPNAENQRKAAQNLPASADDAKKNAQDSGVVVEISEEARQRAGMMASAEQEEVSQETQELTQEEKALIENLKNADREVRAHERAHMAAGGNLVTQAATYDYQTGPDGKRYAVGGEVQIDTSKEQEPQDTINKARRIRAAALAPAKPSSQDRRVAAQAASMTREAAAELAAASAEPASNTGLSETGTDTAAGQVSNTGSAQNSTAAAASAANNFSSSSFMPASFIQQAYQGLSGALQPSLTRMMYA